MAPGVTGSSYGIMAWKMGYGGHLAPDCLSAGTLHWEAHPSVLCSSSTNLRNPPFRCPCPWKMLLLVDTGCSVPSSCPPQEFWLLSGPHSHNGDQLWATLSGPSCPNMLLCPFCYAQCPHTWAPVRHLKSPSNKPLATETQNSSVLRAYQLPEGLHFPQTAH